MKKFITIITIIIASLSLSTSAKIRADNTSNSGQTTQNQRQVSVQKLYANVYDQATGQLIGRYLIATANGYTDSAQTMFNYTLPQFKGYRYTSQAGPISVDWQNPSGITEVKMYVVKNNGTPSQSRNPQVQNKSRSTTSQHPSTKQKTTTNSNQTKSTTKVKSAIKNKPKQGVKTHKKHTKKLIHKQHKPKQVKLSTQGKNKNHFSTFETIVLILAVIIGLGLIIFGLIQMKKSHY